MPQKQPGDDGPSLELPSFGRRRRRRKTAPGTPEPPPAAAPEPGPRSDAEAAPEPGVEPAPEPEPEPAPEQAPGPEAAAAPTGRPLFVDEAPDVDEPAQRSRRPIGGLPASVITGAIVGVFTVGLTWGALRLCEFVQGTSSCGNPGFFLLLAIVILVTLLGKLLLGAFRVRDPGSTSLLGVGLVVVVALLFLVDLLFAWWMILVVPAVAMAAFALAHWVTVTFVEPADTDSQHR